MNTTRPVRMRTCPCGQEFALAAGGQKYCDCCREARAKAHIASRTMICRDCQEEKFCSYGICQECKDAESAARLKDVSMMLNSESLERRREQVEIYIELYMEKFGPDAACLPARRHLALDRKLASLGKKILAGKFPTHDEFRMLVCTIAFRRGILTPEHWGRMRRMYYGSGKWQGELRDLYQAITGTALKERHSRGRNDHMSAKHIEPVLPMLRKMADDPNWKPETEKPVRAIIEEWLEEKGLGRYGALPSHKAAVMEPEVQEISPEQVAHVDQAAIDAVAAELLDGINW